MSPRLPNRGVAAALGGFALVLGTLPGGVASAAVDPANAGQALAWSKTGTPDPTLSATLLNTPVAEVESAGQNAVFRSAAGQVFVESDNAAYTTLPEALDSRIIIDVSVNTSGEVYVALDDTGAMTFWGQVGNATKPGEVDVSNLTQVSLGGGHAVGIKADGTVVAWGSNGSGEATVPPELRDPATSNVVKVTAGAQHSYALRSDGSVVAWGDNSSGQTNLPTGLDEPGSVRDIEARSDGGLALLSNGKLVSWGYKATSGLGSKFNLPPASLDDATITQISASANTNLAIDDAGLITTWGDGTSTPGNVPTDLDGRTLSSVSVGTNYAFAIQRKVMTISESAVTGTAKEGQTLTGTPASFSGGPEITYEWLADDDQIDGATGTTLELTKAEVGKRITFRTVATQDGDVLTSDSPKTAVVAANVAATKTKVNKVKVKHTKKGKKNGKATIKVKVTGKNKPTGKVKFVVKKGKKKVFTKTKKLNKKAVAKVKVKKLKKGKYKVVATYKGNATNKKSKANKKFRVK